MQALSHCNKHCLFALQRQLCGILLPHGVASLGHLLSLSHEMRSLNASDEMKTSERVPHLFLHFHAFYCKALLIEIWYRCPDILGIFQHHHDASVEVKEKSEKSDTKYESPVKLEDFADNLSLDTKPSKSEDTSSISDYSQINGKEKVGEGNGISNVDSKESFSFTERNLVGKQDLKLTLAKLKTVLLSDHHVKINDLRELLTEIRKVTFMKRSQQFFQMNSASSKLNQKKKKAKTQPAHKVEPQGFIPRSSEGDPSSETASRSSSSETGECTQTTENTVSLDEVPETGEKDAVWGNKNNEDGEKRKQNEGGNGLLDDLGVAAEGETTTKDLITPDGKLPVDLRYMASSTNLELLTEEEERVLRELDQFEFKVCNFISILFVYYLIRNVFFSFVDYCSLK